MVNQVMIFTSANCCCGYQHPASTLITYIAGGLINARWSVCLRSQMVSRLSNDKKSSSYAFTTPYMLFNKALGICI